MKRSHLHKFKRMTYGKNGYLIYKCVAGCTTYYPITQMEGIVSQCHACLASFQFSRANLRQVKPKCKDCTGRGEKKDEKVVVATEAILKGLGLK